MLNASSNYIIEISSDATEVSRPEPEGVREPA